MTYFRPYSSERSSFSGLTLQDNELSMQTTDGTERHTISWSGDAYFDQINNTPVWCQNGTLDDGTYVMLVWEHLQDSEDASDCADWDRPEMLFLDAARFYAVYED